MITAFLDSVGLLAIWDEDDQWHERATTAYAQLSREKAVLYSSTFVLAECGNTAARYSHRLEPDLLRARLANSGTLIFPTTDDWDAAWAAYRRHEAGIIAEYQKLKGTRREKKLSDVAIEKCGGIRGEGVDLQEARGAGHGAISLEWQITILKLWG